MDNEKEINRHKKIMDSIKNAKCREDVPNVSISNIASYLANNVYFDDRHISQSLFKPVVDMVIDYEFVGVPDSKDEWYDIYRLLDKVMLNN